MHTAISNFFSLLKATRKHYHGRWWPTGTAERKSDVHGEEGEPTDNKSDNNDGHGTSSFLLSWAPIFSLRHPLSGLGSWLGLLQPGLVLNDMIITVVVEPSLSGGTRHQQLWYNHPDSIYIYLVYYATLTLDPLCVFEKQNNNNLSWRVGLIAKSSSYYALTFIIGLELYKAILSPWFGSELLGLISSLRYFVYL